MSVIDVAPATATRRIMVAYRLADVRDGRPDGIDWYRQAHLEAARLAERYRLTVRQTAGMLAALSPQKDWPVNVRLAWTLCQDRTATGQTGANLAKALAVLDGADPAEVFAPKQRLWDGAKVRAFFANILDPDDADPVTIDRHALSLLLGRKLFDAELGVLGRKGAYDECAEAFRRAATRVGILPSEMQAVCWTVWTAHLRRKRTVHRLPVRRRNLPEVQAA